MLVKAVPTPFACMSWTSRRGFLAGSTSVAVLSCASVFAALQARDARRAGGNVALVPSPYGPLSPTADEATGLPLLQLPQGFAYRSHGWAGDPMNDDRPCPSHHDGMAVMHSGGQGQARIRDAELVLVRNHELGAASSLIAAPSCYDRARRENLLYAGGGTTTLRFRDGEWLGVEASLGGTLANCAGGATPWGTWLSCEETVEDRSAAGGTKHGYVFEVRPDAKATTARPIVAMGRFRHEAVAVDPRTNFAYLTEDHRNRSGLYRFEPRDASGRPGAYEAGGRLKMARVIGRDNADLTVAAVGDSHRIAWVDIDEPDADPRQLALPGVASLEPVSGPFAQGWTRGGLRMSRGEGIWHHRGKLYIVDTGTGRNRAGVDGHGEGAVWELDLANNRLQAVFVSMNAEAANNPDNLCVSPRGGVLLCGDGGGVDDHGNGRAERLLGLTGEGDTFLIASNNIVLTAQQLAAAGKRVAPGDYRRAELAGVCFDPSGSVLFMNAYSPGITFAIQGPWERGPL